MRITNNYNNIAITAKPSFKMLNAKKVSRPVLSVIKDNFKFSKDTTERLYSAIRYYHTGTSQELHEIFNLASNEKELQIVKTLQKYVLAGNKDSAKTIIELLKSKYKDKLVGNFEDYRSYIELNKNSKNIFQNLEELIDSGKYNRKEFDIDLAMSKLDRDSFNNFDKKFIKSLKDNYSEERIELLDYLQNKFLVYREKSEQNNNVILDMYKTTNKNNFALREDIISMFKYPEIDNNIPERDLNSLSSINKIFKKIDEDKNTYKLIEKIVSENIKIKNADYMNLMLENIPSKKALIFYSNFKNIIMKANSSELADALKNHIEDPFFIPKSKEYQYYNDIKYGFAEGDSRIVKIYKRVINKINQIKYYKLGNLNNEQSAVTTADKPASSLNISIAPAVENNSQKIKLTTLSTKERKLKLSNEVNEYIKQKLSPKTVETQQRDYMIAATKMRLKLLPDILESIKITKAEARKEGKRLNIDNRYALQLYERIDGKNRKLVNYMLKKTDTNNKRLFNVREIVTLIDKIKEEFANKMQQNPNLKRKDIKEIYEASYNKMIDNYGKLKRKQTKKVN